MASIKIQERLQTYVTPQPVRDERNYRHIYDQHPPHTFPMAPGLDVTPFATAGYLYSPTLDYANGSAKPRIFCLGCCAHSFGDVPVQNLPQLHASYCWAARSVHLVRSNYNGDHINRFCVVRRSE